MKEERIPNIPVIIINVNRLNVLCQKQELTWWILQIYSVFKR